MIVTNSELTAFRRCPRLHRLSYVLGHERKERAEPLKFGSLIHEGLEAWWLAKMHSSPRALSEALRATEAACTRDSVDVYTQIKTETLLCGYDARWADQELKVLAVEAEFCVPILRPPLYDEEHPCRMAGKIDAIARSADGRLLVVEHKTTSSPLEVGSPYWEKLTLDSQVSAYVQASREIAPGCKRANTCLYDVIAKLPELERKRATPEERRRYTKAGALYANQREHDEEPEEYRARLESVVRNKPDAIFARTEVVRLEREIDEAAEDLWDTAEMVHSAMEKGTFPRYPQNCFMYGRACDFWPVCTRAASLNDPQFLKKTQKHSELGGSHG